MDRLRLTRRPLTSIRILICSFFGPLQADDTILGYTEPSRAAEVAFPESGVLAELSVAEGDVVKKGAKLAGLDTRVLSYDLTIAKEQLRLQELRTAKLQQLWEDKTLSREEHERARADLLISSRVSATSRTFRLSK